MSDSGRLPWNLRPVTPALAQRGEYTPEVGKMINILLLGENVRCTVIEVMTPDVIVVQVTGLVIDKSGHGVKRGSIIACQRSWNGLQEVWEQINEREVQEMEAIERVRAAVVPGASAPPKPVAAVAQATEPEQEPAPAEDPAPPARAADQPRRLGARRSRVGTRTA